MTKTELAEVVAERNSLTKRQANEIVDDVFGTIGSLLASGEDLNINRFGAFEVVDRAPRRARNPKTGAPINVPATKAVKFRPFTPLKEAVKTNGRG